MKNILLRRYPQLFSLYVQQVFVHEHVHCMSVIRLVHLSNTE